MKVKKVIIIFIILLTLSNLCFFKSIYVFALDNDIQMLENNTKEQENKEVKKNPESYWDTKNPPVIYGSTKITIPKDCIEIFNIKDNRFRVFATDFEDGDLTTSIKTEGNVDPHTVGTYNLSHQVKDSHGNTTTIDVPVIVTDEPSNTDIVIERTLYTLVNPWAMELAGMSRCNNGDRQLLGLFIPENGSVRVRIIDAPEGTTKMQYSFDNNDDRLMIRRADLANDGQWHELTNVHNGQSYAAVPSIYTTYLNKGDYNVTTTAKIEIAFTNETATELDYYHYGDDEEKFFSKWRENQNGYGAVGNEVVQVIVPFADNGKLTNYYTNSFKTLDQFLEYWKKAVDKMDEYIGLDLNPEKISDQNVRTKYFVRPNVHGVGGAYYGADHVGINSSSVSAFFQMNWGGLHEFAHGYQGNFGKGNMGLGETSNNIIGYYIQQDKSIYFHPGNWLGDLDRIEASNNALREEGKALTQISEGPRLYVIINLLNTLERGTTYGKMFSWFREKINTNTLPVDINANQDIYVLALADIYHINILPYMEEWGTNVSQATKETVNSKNYPTYMILKDMVSDNALNKIKENENINLNYGLVTNEVFKKANIVGNLVINIDIDDMSRLNGKDVLIKDGEKTIKTMKITTNSLVINDIPVGSYYVQMPIVNAYDQSSASVMVKEATDNVYTYKYTNLKDIDNNNYLYMRVLGWNFDTIGFQLTFKDDYKKATISYPNGAGMSGNEYVKIYDQNGNIISDNITTGGFFDFNQGSHDIDLQAGYVVEVNYPSRYANKVKFYSVLTGKEVVEYRATGNTTRYIITEDGIRLETMSDEKAQEISYQNLKEKIIKVLNTYKENVTEEELNNRLINFKEKANVLYNYNQLVENDKSPYTELIEKIIKGGVPTVKTIGKIEYKIGEEINLYSLISAEDNEDGILSINSNTTKITSNLNNNQIGTYNVKYEVSDSDENVTIHTLTIKIINEHDKPVTEIEEQGLFFKSTKYKILNNNENRYLCKISPKTKLTDFLANCETNENASMTVYKQDETQLEENELVCTGMTLVIKLEQKEIRLTIAVMGDVDGDAEITVNDLAKMKLHLIGSQLLSEISLIAADIDDEEGLTINDIARVKSVLIDLLDI